MDRHRFRGRNRPTFIDGPTQHVHDATERFDADRHRDRRVGVHHRHAPAQPIGAAERDRAHDAITQLLLDFERQPDLVQFQRVVDFGDLVARKFHVDDRADALNNGSLAHVAVLGIESDCECVNAARPLYTAAAPPTISESSLVIAACRVLL